MRKITIFTVLMLALSLTSCSRSSKGGSGSGDEMGDGNIPLAGAGSELADVNFDFDSSALTDLGRERLKQNSQWLQDNPGRSFTIEGHCDERGTQEYNLALGERRAQGAYDYLKTLGVEGSRMSTTSYGEEIPLDPGHDEAAWAKNRRAHFSLR